MPRDPKKYPVADQPWSYGQVCGVMTNWGYSPVGDHSAEAIENPEAFLRWEKVEADGKKSAFVISSPKWSAAGSNSLYWPMNLVMEALTDQAVLHRTGLITIPEKIAKMTLQRNGVGSKPTAAVKPVKVVR